MISLALVGDIRLTSILRIMTLHGLISYKKEFLNKIGNDFKDVFPDLRDYATKKYNQLLSEASTDGSWGNEYHLLAISWILNINIYIYSSFKKYEEFKNESIEIIAKAFNSYKILFGVHLRYIPLQNSAHRTIFGFFDSERSHYTALIPGSKNISLLVPKNAV